MPRPKKNPGFDPNIVMNQLLDAVLEEYYKSIYSSDWQSEIQTVAAELNLAPHKVRKLLITAGARDNKVYYTNQSCRQVQSLHNKGRSISEIMLINGFSRTSVCCYLPYSKGLYKANELSLAAEAIRRYRRRQELCREFADQIELMDHSQTEDFLWETIRELEGCIFKFPDCCANSQQFRYKIKTDALHINKETRIINKSAVILAFEKAREIQKNKGYVSGPKQIGTDGAIYLYPIFLRLGICTRPVAAETVKEKG